MGVGLKFDDFLGVPWRTQAEVIWSGDGKVLVGGPYSKLETMKLTAKNFDRKQETSKL